MNIANIITNFIQSGVPSLIPDSIPDMSSDWKLTSSMSIDELLEKFMSSLTSFAVNLTVALIVFYVGKFIIKRLVRLVAGIMIRREVDRSLSSFVLSMIRMVLYFILIVTVIGILGIETSSFIAIFASAGVAVGMAMSGTLQNFAGGVLILLLKPYKIGDYIEAQGYAGTVKEIQIFHTIITTYDNKCIIIPNGGLSTGSVNNWSREDYRRVEWSVTISYGDSVEAARAKLLGILADDERVVKQYVEDDREMRAQAIDTETPKDGNDTNGASTGKPRAKWLSRLFHHHSKVKERIEDWKERQQTKVLEMLPRIDRRPVVVVDELADSSVVLKVRAWTTTASYWSLFYDINERIYNELPSAGIHFPFPQLDVHLPDKE